MIVRNSVKIKEYCNIQNLFCIFVYPIVGLTKPDTSNLKNKASTVQLRFYGYN